MTLQCTVLTKSKIVKFEERRSILNVRNSNGRELHRVQIDGCAIVDGRRCDWLLVDGVTGTEIFIELKGADVGEGIKQLCSSVQVLSEKPRRKYGYIICTRSPISSPAIQKLQKSLLKSHSMTLRIKTTVHTVDIEDLVG